MAIEHSQIFDAPETPAPLFAYRAFRGIFFASPDNSPVKYEENKENPPVSPPKKAMKQEQPIKLTPSRKQNRIVAPSPTKSILRAPGMPTPRRDMLRDITVSFKDVRKSASPELSRKAPAAENKTFNLQPTITTKSEIIRLDLISSRDKTTSPRRTTTIPKDQQHSVTTSNPPDFDIEAYTQTTEKEMKKLIKYGQKMREYARKQDEENVKLHNLLEEARSENERLRMRIEVREGLSGSRTLSQRREMSDVRKSHQSIMFAPVIPPLISLRDESSTESRQLIRPQHVKPPVVSKKAPDISQKNLTRHQSPVQDILVTSPNRDIQIEAPVRLASVSLNSNKRIAPDRLQAARERIQKKAQLRKASAESGIEGSQLDWAGL